MLTCRLSSDRLSARDVSGVMCVCVCVRSAEARPLGGDGGGLHRGANEDRRVTGPQANSNEAAM